MRSAPTESRLACRSRRRPATSLERRCKFEHVDEGGLEEVGERRRSAVVTSILRSGRVEFGDEQFVVGTGAVTAMACSQASSMDDWVSAGRIWANTNSSSASARRLLLPDPSPFRTEGRHPGGDLVHIRAQPHSRFLCGRRGVAPNVRWPGLPGNRKKYPGWERAAPTLSAGAPRSSSRVQETPGLSSRPDLGSRGQASAI